MGGGGDGDVGDCILRVLKNTGISQTFKLQKWFFPRDYFILLSILKRKKKESCKCVLFARFALARSFNSVQSSIILGDVDTDQCILDSGFA